MFEQVVNAGWLHLEAQLAAHDAADVEHVVDETGLEIEIAADHFDILAEGRGQVGILLHGGDGHNDGGERGAELMAEDGEESVPGGACGAGVVEAFEGLHRDRGQFGEAGDDSGILGVETFILPVGDDPDGADGLVILVERDEEDLGNLGIDGDHVGEIRSGVVHQQRRVAVEHGAARAVGAWEDTAFEGTIFPGHRMPAEDFPAIL